MTHKTTQTLGDLVTRIGNASCNDAAVATTVAQLLNSGQVRLTGQAGKRVVVRPSLDAFLRWVRS